MKKMKMTVIYNIMSTRIDLRRWRILLPSRTRPDTSDRLMPDLGICAPWVQYTVDWGAIMCNNSLMPSIASTKCA
jgi:hypothetical protein